MARRTKGGGGVRVCDSSLFNFCLFSLLFELVPAHELARQGWKLSRGGVVRGECTEGWGGFWREQGDGFWERARRWLLGESKGRVGSFCSHVLTREGVSW